MRPYQLFCAAALLAAGSGPLHAQIKGASGAPGTICSRPIAAVAPPGRAVPLPVDEIIRRFAAKEAEFRAARDNYTYTQSLRVQEFAMDGTPGGEYRITSDIIFTPDGRRYEHITYAPPVSLTTIGITPEDVQDLANIQPFVLTTENLPDYKLDFQGREKVDEIDTYVFRVSPRKMEKGKRYFEGSIWVDDQDLQIVKTYGKAVPDLHNRHGDNLFPRFETYRENIDGKYWFPTYTRANDVLHFKSGDVRIRMTVRYANYKQFRATVRILNGTAPAPEASKPQPPH